MPRLLTVLVLALALVLPPAPAAPAAGTPGGADATAGAAAKKKRKAKKKKRCPSKRQAAQLRKRGKKVPKRCRKKRRAVPKPAPRPAPPRRVPYTEWKEGLSKERFAGVSVSTHYLTAADGTQLSLTVHLPTDLPEGEKVPALMQMTPYRPLDQMGSLDEWLSFVKRGAAYVTADERGTGGSEGCLDFGGSADRSDAVVFAKWIREQPWSNGRIVTDGVSHPGMGSVVAHAAIPGLTGALAHAPVVSYYQDEWLQGAKFEDQFNGPAYEAIETVPPLPPEFQDPNALKAQAAACRGRTTLDFTPYDGPFGEVWQDRDLSRHLPAERRPILLTHGFVDVNVHPDHAQMYWDALPADYPKHAIFGWWDHGWPTMGAPEFTEVRHRWLDALLFGRDNGLAAEPRVLVQASDLSWYEGHDWPLEQSEPLTLRPSAAGGLATAAPAAGSVSYPDEPGAERGDWGASKVEFATEPLPAARIVNGAPVLDLVGSSTATSTKWVAYLFQESPDGTRDRVTHGYADSHTWRGESEWLDIEPGKTYRWRLKLQPTAARVEAGSKLVLLIASQDSRRTQNAACYHREFGCYSPSGILPAATVGRATNTVHVGEGQTALQLHWADPAKLVRAPVE